MNTQKSAQQKLESWKGTFLKLGMILSMLFVLLAFEYRVNERVVPEFDRPPDLMTETDNIEITIPKPPKPPPPPDMREIVTAPDDEIKEEYIPEIDIEAFPNQPVWDFPEYDDEPDVSEPDLVHVRAEIMPEFPGGEQAMYAFLYGQIKYPRAASDLNIQGRVIIGFIIEKDGSVSNVHVMRGIGGGCDEEAVRAVSSMPRWNPGRMGTQPVRVTFSLPINFRLNQN
ncbi:MAG: energy transducer TonB [Bacteroidetes bacterium]|nr:MAG: energy transducer TonB [Bacteroidota bacterium]